MKITCTILVICLFFIASCSNAPKDPNKQVDEGKITGEVYKSDEVGWTMQIPKGWTVTSKDQLEANDAKGLSMIEKSTGTAVNSNGLKHLVSFQKDKLNSLASTTQPVKEEHPGEYNENVPLVHKLLFDTYQKQGIKSDTSSGTETIDGVEFTAFYIKIYSQEGKLLLNQILYNKLLNGYDFGVNINYNSDENKDILLKTWRASTFKK